MENVNGEGEQEYWFEEGGCIESREMESGSWKDCCQSEVNPATPVYGDKPGSKLELIDMPLTSNFDYYSTHDFHSIEAINKIAEKSRSCIGRKRDQRKCLLQFVMQVVERKS